MLPEWLTTDVPFFVALVEAVPALVGLAAVIRSASLAFLNHRARSLVLKKAKRWTVIIPLYDEGFQKREDMDAALMIRDWCKGMGVECSIQYDTDNVPGDTSLFFVCGPAKNKKVGTYYKNFSLKLVECSETDEQDVTHGFYVIQGPGGANYKAEFCADEMSGDVTLAEDYAILARRSMEAEGNYCIFCLGIHAAGSYGAAWALTRSLVGQMTKAVRKTDSFESIVSVPCDGDKVVVGNVDFLVPPRRV